MTARGHLTVTETHSVPQSHSTVQPCFSFNSVLNTIHIPVTSITLITFLSRTDLF